MLSPYDIWSVICKEENLASPADRNLASECVGQYLLTRPQQFSNLLDVVSSLCCTDSRLKQIRHRGTFELPSSQQSGLQCQTLQKQVTLSTSPSKVDSLNPSTYSNT